MIISLLLQVQYQLFNNHHFEFGGFCYKVFDIDFSTELLARKLPQNLQLCYILILHIALLSSCMIENEKNLFFMHMLTFYRVNTFKLYAHHFSFHRQISWISESFPFSWLRFGLLQSAILKIIIINMSQVKNHRT